MYIYVSKLWEQLNVLEQNASKKLIMILVINQFVYELQLILTKVSNTY